MTHKFLIWLWIGVLGVALATSLVLHSAPPVTTVVTMHPYETQATATVASLKVVIITREVVREVVVTRIVEITTPIQQAADPDGIDQTQNRIEQRIEVVLVTPTPEAGLSVAELAAPPASPTPEAGLSVAELAAPPTATSTRVRQSVQDDAFSSPLQTPVPPLETPHGDMPSAEVQAAVYALIQRIADAESAYYAQRGMFSQLLWGETATCPEGEHCISVAYPVGLQAGVHVYVSPDGTGYEVIVSVDGWRLIVASGPESAVRDEGWHAE